MFLRFVKPASPTLVETPPSGPGWIHEIKVDGYRTQVLIDGQVCVRSRNGLDWTKRYPFTIAAAAELLVRSAIIDGEMALLDQDGKSDFGGLLRAINRWPHLLTFVAFDVLHLDGEDLRGQPVESRRAKLRELLVTTPAGWMMSDEFEGDGAALFEAARKAGLEGIVSKRRGSRYCSGDTEDWLKTKCFVTGTFDVIGVDRTPGGAPTAILARDGQLAGDAFVTLPAEIRELFWHYTEARSIPVATIPIRRMRAIWLQSGLRARVRYLQGDGLLRHATLQSLELNADPTH